MKAKVSLAAIVSTTAIASSTLLFSSVRPAQACHFTYSTDSTPRYEQANWLRSPWAIVITLPGIAIATALSVGERYYKR